MPRLRSGPAAAGPARFLWATVALQAGLAAALSPASEEALSPVLSPAENKKEGQNDTRLPDLPDAGWDGLTSESNYSAKVDLHQPEHGLRTPVSWDKFPLWLNDRRLVAKFQRVYHGVHIFTVGVYLSRKCDIWGKAWQASSSSELLESAVGNTTVRYEIVSKYLTRKMWAQDLIGKEIIEHYRGPKNERATMARLHERLTYKGPIFHTGAVLDFVLQDKGVWYFFNDQYIGKVGNHESSKAMLGAWVDERSSEVFRDPVFNSLARGVDGRSMDLVARTGEESLPAWSMLIGVLISAGVALALAACCVCCYWNLKKTAEEGSFDSEYVETAA